MKPRFFLAAALAASIFAACSGTPASAPADAAHASDSTASSVDAGSVRAEAAADESLPATDAESGWAATYEGKFDGKLDVSLSLNGLGDFVRGTITYKKAAKPIIVIGSFLTDGTFFLREFDPSGNVTGVLSGIEKSKKLTGTWYAPASEREMKIDLDAVTVQEEGTVTWPYTSKAVAGEYRYQYGTDGPMGTLSVTSSGADKVKFSMNCVGGAPGRNMAFIDETEATLDGREVHYKQPDMDCEFVISFFDGFAIVKYVDEHYDCEFGMSATVEGEFLKVK